MVEYLPIYVIAGELILTVVVLVVVFRFARTAGRLAATAVEPLAQRLESIREDLAGKFSGATADMAQRLEKTGGDLRQELTDRTHAEFNALRDSIGAHLASGREEQGRALKLEIEALTNETRKGLEAIRQEVDQKLLAIGKEVQGKLDQNIREGFQQFEKVQQHLQAAQEQLKNVSAIGSSINDLNNLLKLPHLRGRFGEASLERLLEDFLPATMYELQAHAGQNGQSRPDAVIKFPDCVLPIDAKFPREQVLPLFESSGEAELAAAREQFARVIKEQGRRIAGYIHPENGTTDMALMYLPSETLYMETILNGELSEWLNKQRIFPVSPNTLIVTLQSISMVFKMYQFAKSYEQATEELAKAQKTFAFFESKFEEIGKSLVKAQEAYGVASGHLTRYRSRVVSLSGEPIPEIEQGRGEQGNIPEESAS
ncbi:MAG: DNA recombination protein RmuC [Candidatus Binatales bacterium]